MGCLSHWMFSRPTAALTDVANRSCIVEFRLLIALLCLCSITSCYSIVGSVDSHGTRCVLWTISVMSTPLELNCASDVYRVDNPILWTFWSTLILICLFSFWIKVARLALIVVKEIDFFFSLCVCVWWGCGGVRSRLLLLVSLISPCNLAPLKSSQKL